MDINLLVINVGNTRAAIGAFVSGELRHVVRIPHDDRAAVSSAITAAWAEISEQESAAIAGACVNPNVLEPIEHIVKEITDRRVQWVGTELDVPIPIMTDNPKQTGIDRVLNIAAAHEQMEKACVVVDAGTAITIDICDDKGAFLGGAIAPGVIMQLSALNERTAKLPRVTLDAPPTAPIGKSTEDAIRQGVYHGVRGMVKELAEQYAVVLGQWPEIIATGGDAQLLFADWELIHAISPDLTLYGVALAFTNHHIKHDT